LAGAKRLGGADPLRGPSATSTEAKITLANSAAHATTGQLKVTRLMFDIVSSPNWQAEAELAQPVVGQELKCKKMRVPYSN
jgi:hypothetical protein